jgi:hypothetical protein
VFASIFRASLDVLWILNAAAEALKMVTALNMLVYAGAGGQSRRTIMINFQSLINPNDF